jgi:hypothetical protein
MGGFKLQPREGLDIDIQLTWNSADGGLDPFQMPVPAEAVNANQLWDFSQTHSYSDQELTTVSAEVDFSYAIREGLWLRGGYQYLDLDDDAPYLYDVSGTVDFFDVGIGWSF